MNADIIGIKEENIQKAYGNGCDEVKKALEDLFPSLELGMKPKPEPYAVCELDIGLSQSTAGGYFIVIGPEGRRNQIMSMPCCKEDETYIWVPFYRGDGMRISKTGNFEILRK